MPSDPSLILQLAHKAQRFHSRTQIQQAVLAEAIGMDESNYSAFLNGKRGLSATSTCLLLKYINMPAAQAVATFSQRPTSRIVNFQQHGKRMKLHTGDRMNNVASIRGKELTSRIECFQSSNDGSWVSGQSGTDPNDAAIISIPTGVKRKDAPVHESSVCQANLDDTLNVLGAVKVIHQQAIDAISDYIAKATPNRSGVTSPTNERFGRRG